MERLLKGQHVAVEGEQLGRVRVLGSQALNSMSASSPEWVPGHVACEPLLMTRASPNAAGNRSRGPRPVTKSRARARGYISLVEIRSRLHSRDSNWRAVLGLSVCRRIRRHDPPPHLHRIHVEGEVPRHGEEPDVLGAVLPVAVGSATFLSLPGDAVLHAKVPLADALHGCGTTPVATDVDRRRRFQYATERTQPGIDPALVPIVRKRLERAAVERLGEVVRWIHDQQVNEARGKVRERLDEVLAHRSADKVRRNGWCSQAHESLRQRSALPAAEGHRAVATSPMRISHGEHCCGQ